MPIKDKEKLREYQKELMRKRRQGLTNKDVRPIVSPSLLDLNNSVSPIVSPVSPKKEMLDLGLTVIPVIPNIEQKLDLVSPSDVRPEKNVRPEEVVRPCSKCSELEKENQKLQQTVDNCNKRHIIPKEVERSTLALQSKDRDFINLMWDRRHKKFIFYGCADSCWEGKYCNNCHSLEEKLIKRIKEKYYESQSK